LAALRKVLGEGVFQKGSNITAERLRFDFSYPEKMTLEQINEVENIVNEQIEKDLPVTMEEMTLEEAKKSGAMGVFESKYGEKVKVYTIGSGDKYCSREICGGPHASRTGELGHFSIKKEESSSAGVRRIKAVLE
jgi:alanyl-tRNA synthetase